MKTTTLQFSAIALFAMLSCFSRINAQTTIAIGSGTTSNTSTGYPAPYGNWYFGSKHQILIKASELTSAGMSAGTISKLIFNVAVPNGVPLTGFTIRMASTSSTALTTTFVNTGFTTVFGPQSYTDITGWNTHTFSNPFYWNGTSNIIVETCFNNTAYTHNAQMYYSTTSFNSVAYFYQDISTACGTTTASALSMSRPNIRFTFTPSTNPPTVNFGANKTFSCNGLINFTDSTCCNVNSRLWDFGDGTTSTLQNPSHTYTSSGVFSVSLIATNSYGSDTLLKNNYLTVSLGGGPVTPSCTSQTSAYCCGFGITNVTFNTINNTSANGIDGYKNYCCLYGTTVYAGSSYSISVSTPQPSAHNVMVWIDYDNNGIFDPSAELAFSSTSTTIASGSISIPLTAVLNTTLRMRVSADFDGNAIPSPCGTLQYGQAEDYSVTIIANTNPPVADFSAQQTVSCDGIIAFTDNSANTPTSWLWDFGDGTTSTVNNPTHTYAINGPYTVTLTSTNAFGSNTIVKNNYISITLGSTPIAANCIPPTVGYCCGYGIYKVSLNTINNTTANGIDGYKDYTCPQQTTLTQGTGYSIFVQTGSTNAQDTRAWIDINNNGIFETSELMFTSSNTFNASGTVTMPTGTVLNTPLRMRVFSDNTGSNPGPCSNAAYGQAEDYTVIVIPDTSPPIAKFGANVTSSCSGSIVFADSSLKTPTSWLWDFGDGTTSTLQNPAHQYTATGIFTVTLIATNTFGSDTLIKTNYINVASLAGSPVASTCVQNTTNYCCGMGVYNVTFNTINNSTSSGADGYKDYSCAQQTTVIIGQTYSISIHTGVQYSENVKVWIDYNNDGTFNSANEQVFSDYANQNHNGSITIPGTAVLNTPLRLRVASDNNTIYVCSNLYYGQAEDYSVTILSNIQPPVADFSANYTSINPGGTVVFTDLSTYTPTSWHWIFSGGSPSSSTVQNPSVVYNALGTYTVKLVATNSNGSDSITKTAYINVVNSVNMCSGTNSTVAASGVLYDSGGPSANYSGSENCNFLISPSCASSVTLNFSAFNIESGYDFFNAYNGTNTSAPLLLSTTGSNIPASITANSGSMYITFTSDVSVQSSGFAADWTSVSTSPTIAPFADFGKIQNNCQNFQFNDSSLNCPSSWQWDFGDGATSVLQNPFHNYTSTGTYNVGLIVCNGHGCDTLIKTNYVLISQPLVPASCSPGTVSYCCGMGIYNTTFNTINKTSADGIDGYKDYSCAQQTQVLAGQTYAVSITTDNAYSNHVKIWIDYNNDGVFNTTNEQVFYDSALTLHTGSIVIPATPVLNTILRMRVAADFNNVYPCTNVEYGQMEDYSIIIQANNVPPEVNFSANSPSSCYGIISFDNTTSNATSYAWDFGDGTSSSAQYPTHTYNANGVYTVTLIACNSFGCDTLIIPNYVNIILSPLGASCSPITTGYCCGMGIYNVTFNTINKSSADGIDDYQDYSCTDQTVVSLGQSYSVSVTTDNSYQNYVKIWIDYNNDGLFNSTNEQVFFDSAITNHNNTIVIPGTAILNTTVRMRVAADIDNVFPCANVTYGQVEDYSVLIQDNMGINDPGSNNNLIVYPNPSNQFININYTFSGFQEFTIYLYNMLGEKIYSEKQTGVSTYKKSLETTNYPTGVYQLIIKSKNEHISRQINIIH